MTKQDKIESIRPNINSTSDIGSYFERAGAFGHIALMVIFYIIIFAILWIAR